MTVRADQLRDRRRILAAPGGSHDRLIARLSMVLPALVGILVAVMLVTPLWPRGEVSFLLDRNKVAVTQERLRVDNAMYRGDDNEGRPFSVIAQGAVQHSAAVPVVAMDHLAAHIQLKDGPADVTAPTGDYNLTDQRLDVRGPVRIRSANGSDMTTSGIAIDLRHHRAVGSGGVTGSLNSGTFSADSMSADLQERVIRLDGRAHLRMVPGSHGGMQLTPAAKPAAKQPAK
jgi:lipopolysaccharide export system protein LptC